MTYEQAERMVQLLTTHDQELSKLVALMSWQADALRVAVPVLEGVLFLLALRVGYLLAKGRA